MNTNKPAKNDAPKPNLVWIELPNPRDADHAKELCDRMNTMLDKLTQPEDRAAHTRKFFWLEKKRCYGYGDAMGYTTQTDNGEWFNLDYLAQ